ncbi:MCM DNA helicase complex subunit mcm6, partial [Cladochytrium tenue]
MLSAAVPTSDPATPMPLDGDGDVGAGAGGGLANAAARAKAVRRPTINLLNDRIPPVVDATAEAACIDFQRFLTDFTDDDGVPYYLEQIRSLPNHDSTTVFVDFAHLLQSDELLAELIKSQYYRLDPYLKKAVQSLVQQHVPHYLHIRVGMSDEAQFVREFWVSWYNTSGFLRLRELRTNHLGTLQAITGTVTRTSDIRPELLYGTFQCEDCGTIMKDVEQEFMYTQ